jgi:hypothetical protein
MILCILVVLLAFGLALNLSALADDLGQSLDHPALLLIDKD